MGLYDSHKSSSSSTKIILIASLVLALITAVGLGIYFAYKKSSDAGDSIRSSEAAAHQKVDELEAEAERAARNSTSSLPTRNNQNAEPKKFENTYLEIDKEFMAPVAGSKKIMVVKVALMTHYDQRVFDNVKKHEFAIRSAIIEVMRQTTELDATKPNFRVDLAGKIKIVMNEILMKYEDFGGIEDVFFTSFVMQ
jgi:flagellar protein FliL